MSRYLPRAALLGWVALTGAACSADAPRAGSVTEVPHEARGDDPDEEAGELAALLADGAWDELAGEAPALPEPRPCSGAACATQAIGRWSFDDCDGGAATLEDSTSHRVALVRSSQLQCAEGWSGRAIELAGAHDLVYAPDRPDFDFEQGFTLALWAAPRRGDGVRTLARKRSAEASAFALLLHDDRYRIVVQLAAGRAIELSAPAPLDRWTHVAATYDGSDLRLFLDGSEVASRYAPGTVARGEGPLLFGNDGARRNFDGRIDEARIDRRAAPPSEITGFTCQRRDPALEAVAETSAAVASGTPVRYELTITNRNEPSCPPELYLVSATPPEGELVRTEPGSLTSPPTASGEHARLEFVVTSGQEQEAGSYALEFFARSQLEPGAGAVLAATTAATYAVAEPEGCHVAPSRTLLIRHPSVVDDPQRAAAGGSWSFEHLLGAIAPSPDAAAEVTEALFRSFTTEQIINGFEVRPRPGMESAVLRSWPRTAAGELDLSRAPVRLLAIVHRLDLPDLARGRAGEGRFVFNLLGDDGRSLVVTLILEYALPARDEREARAWADAVHALQREPLGSEAYNRGLEALTRRYTARGAMPQGPNGSALLRVRSNDQDLGRDGQWEMREFHLAADGGALVPAPLQQTPDPSFNGTESLARFIDAHEASILSERHDVPAMLDDTPFQAGALINRLGAWNAKGITNPEARHKFSLNTCDGCHGGETFTSFFHVFPRKAGAQSLLSGFLTGTRGMDLSSGETRSYSELARRRQLLERVVCE